MLFHVIVTSQVERRAHALNVAFRKERADVHLKARRFRHCASHVFDYVDVAVSFVNPNFLSLDLRLRTLGPEWLSQARSRLRAKWPVYKNCFPVRY